MAFRAGFEASGLWWTKCVKVFFSDFLQFFSWAVKWSGPVSTAAVENTTSVTFCKVV